MNSGLVLLDARTALRAGSKTSQLVVADLTWTHSLPFQFLLDFDMIIIPASTSRVEMTSSEIFVLEYLQRNLVQSRNSRQMIVMTPSRINPGQSIEGIFPFIAGNRDCFISPPIHNVSNIDHYYGDSLLCDASDPSVSQNFCEFGDFIHEKYIALSTPETVYQSSDSIALSKANKNPLLFPAQAKNTQTKSSKFGRKAVDLFIPKFLLSTRCLDSNEG